MVRIDTDIIINLFRKGPSTMQLLSRLEKTNHLFSTTCINTFEIWRGILKSRTEEEKRNAIEFLERLAHFEFSYAASQKAAEILEDLKKRGEMIELTDILIAAICMVQDESLLTINTKHFSKIQGLKLTPLV
ncbi:type II toxin-antitoxin system VapC family toxin [Candidatus Pacearchaeota archaeon]|nr:type II toxin-antitoxin system VapC family toxin [Candidatus Pacearchaeota archaeon]